MNQNNMLTEFNVGGSHEENKLGGIPIGVNPQTGAPVTVEEGETKTKVGGLDYVFSNNFKVSKSIIKNFKLPSSLEGLPMSDASKKVSEMFKDRKDSISQNTMNQFLSRLSDAQENLRQEKIQKLQETIALNNQYPDESLEGQMPPEAQQFQEQPQTGQPMQQVSPDELGAMGQQQMFFGGYSAEPAMPTYEQTGSYSNTIQYTPNTPENKKYLKYRQNQINAENRNNAALLRNSNGNSDLDLVGDIATKVVSAAPAVMGLVDQAKGNTSANVTQSALSGAMSGLSAGAAFGPIGMGVGAVGGLIAGHIGGNKAKKNLINQSNEAAMNYNAQFQEQYAYGGFPGLGAGMLTNNIYGGFKPQVKQKNNPLLQQQFELGQNMMNPDYLNKVTPHYANQNPIKNAQSFLANQGYTLKGGVDGVFGDSSKMALNQWRKANNISTTGELSPADYEAMGYTNMGYTPYEEVLPELVIDGAKPAQYADPRVVPAQYQNNQEDPKDQENKNKFNYNQMMRLMTPLGNALQLGRLQEPTMGNMHQDLTKARRDYIDEEALVRGVRNQGNTLNRAIQQSGMTEGARRANMLGANLNTQNAIGSAMLQAQQANRQIDAQADSIDAQTRQMNQRNRMLAEENFERDKGAYNTERSKLQSQIFTDIGNVGLEGLRADRVAKVAGYDVEGNYIVDRSTGKKYNEGQIDTLLKELKAESASASTEHGKKALERQIKELESQRAKLQKVWDSGKQSNTKK